MPPIDKLLNTGYLVQADLLQIGTFKLIFLILYYILLLNIDWTSSK